MRTSSLSKPLALLALCAFAAFTVAAQDPSQQQTSDPVADAARKAREQQKTAPKPKKVFTNDDIPAATTTGDAKATDANASAAQGADDSSSDNDPKSEAYWR